jgi:hypothetical protein
VYKAGEICTGLKTIFSEHSGAFPDTVFLLSKILQKKALSLNQAASKQSKCFFSAASSFFITFTISPE